MCMGSNVHGTRHDAWQGYLASGYLRSCELQQAKYAAPHDAIACMAAVLDCMCWRIAASASRPSKSRPLLRDVCTAVPHLCHLAHVGSMGILLVCAVRPVAFYQRCPCTGTVCVTYGRGYKCIVSSAASAQVQLSSVPLACLLAMSQ